MSTITELLINYSKKIDKNLLFFVSLLFVFSSIIQKSVTYVLSQNNLPNNQVRPFIGKILELF